MAIHYPVKDFASKQRQDFIKEQAKKVFKPERVIVEEYEEHFYIDAQAVSDAKFLIAILAGILLLLSMFLTTTQAKAEDGNVMPISPMSLVDSFGGE
jgi:hypothetical protein